jgi:hypothetical protein
MRQRKAPAKADPGRDLAKLRHEITDLVARNAVAMVQQAIVAVREQGRSGRITCASVAGEDTAG